MNYLIRTISFNLFLFLGLSNICGQPDSIITITGKFTYEVQPIAHSIEFSFIENGVTCGPNAQFESLEEQFNYFNYEIINNREISDRIELIDNPKNYFSRQPTNSYSFYYNNIEEMKLIYSWAIEGFAEKIVYKSIFPDFDFVDEDLAAIGALEDAKQRALKIARLRGFNDVEILSIDDDTGSVLGLSSLFYSTATSKKTSFIGKDFRTKSYQIEVKFQMK